MERMYSNDTVITVKSTDHGYTKDSNGGKALACLKNGTVEEFRARLDKKGLKGMASWTLRTAVELKLITMKEAKAVAVAVAAVVEVKKSRKAKTASVEAAQSVAA